MMIDSIAALRIGDVVRVSCPGDTGHVTGPVKSKRKGAFVVGIAGGATHRFDFEPDEFGQTIKVERV